jgi:hypothetical protein
MSSEVGDTTEIKIRAPLERRKRDHLQGGGETSRKFLENPD